MSHPLDARIAELERELRDLRAQRNPRTAAQMRRWDNVRKGRGVDVVSQERSTAQAGVLGGLRDPLEVALFGAG